jgi:hypothetical protein
MRTPDKVKAKTQDNRQPDRACDRRDHRRVQPVALCEHAVSR